jgi:WD40 repeat protein
MKLIIGIAVALLIILVSYYQLMYKPAETEGNMVKLEKIIPAHTSDIWVAKFSPVEDIFATGSVDSTIRIYKTDGTLLRVLKQPDGVTGLAFSPDGKSIVTSSYDRKIRLWNVQTGALLHELTGHEKTAWCVAYSPDGKTVASCDEDGLIKLWDVVEGKPITTIHAHALNVWIIKFSPDGQTIVSGSFDHSVKIWDAHNGKLVKEIAGHTEAVVDLAFNMDGSMLATTSDDKTIKLWSMPDARLIRSLDVPEHAQAVAFSNDGKRLLTGGRDKTMIGELLQNFFGDSQYNKGVSMRLWDVASGKIIQTFAQHENDVNDVAFSRDGKSIVTASSDRTVGLWRMIN